MKSHDFHILMQHLLPIAICKILPDKVTAVLMELSSFFRQLCAKNLSLSDLDSICSHYQPLRNIFWSHILYNHGSLTCHLVTKAKLGVQCSIDGCILWKGIQDT
ncbi:hypothetical protein AABB24_020107 [Solanum stoloniferum]|uniref:Uncharacterized protein n=1 Tax=Solanum stoloniferum TaxID=62892 RepID=A0ABD2T6R3_9SOLN